MQSLFDKFGVTATYVLSAIVIVVLLLVLLLIMRALFSRRVRPSGGRARQPRLGVVDAFDIDRQRQLVLVRRDNVEHLIMIGGPNDVVVESAIVRGGESRSGEARRQSIEETGAAATPPAAPVPAPAPAAAPTPAPTPSIQAPPSAPVRAPAPVASAAPTPMPPLRQPVAPPPPPPRQPMAPSAGVTDLAPQVRTPTEAPSSAPAPVSSTPSRLPPRVTPPPRSVSPLPASRPPGTAGAGALPPRSSAPTPPAPAAQPAAPQPVAPQPVLPQASAQTPSQAPSVQPPRPENGAAGAARRFEFGRALQRATTEQPKTDQGKTDQGKTDQPGALPSQGEEIEAAAPPVTAEAPREPPAKLPEAARPADPLDALEEEMAKLLGRPPGQS